MLMGLIIVPMAFLRPETFEMFGILLVGAGIFLIGNQLTKRGEGG